MRKSPLSRASIAGGRSSASDPASPGGSAAADTGGLAARASYAGRLISVLQLFAEHSDSLSLGQVGAQLGLPGSSTHRLLEPLVTLGLIERAQKRRYRIGTELYRLALLIQDQFELMNIAKPIMIETARLCGETCLLGLLTPNRRRLVLVHKIDASRSSPCSFDLLQNITPAWGSVGRATMAWVPAVDLLQIVKDAGPAPVTGEALPEPATLQKELKEIRRTGLAYSHGKRADASGIAAPFFDGSGQIRGAMGIILPAERRLTTEIRVRVGRALKSQTGRLSRILGYRSRRSRSVPADDG